MIWVVVVMELRVSASKVVDPGDPMSFSDPGECEDAPGSLSRTSFENVWKSQSVLGTFGGGSLGVSRTSLSFLRVFRGRPGSRRGIPRGPETIETKTTQTKNKNKKYFV